MSCFFCPVCGGALSAVGNSLKCRKNHSYDISSAGYVNLLLEKKSAAPGDSKEMCAARNRFLSRGYYSRLAGGLAHFVAECTAALPAPTVVDAACGEGYYTAAMYEALAAAGKSPVVAGVDLAKFALKYAGKRCKGIHLAAASIFDMPLPPGFADVLTNIFAPVAEAEFYRVLKPSGRMLIVGPGERHLWGLKEFLYEKPYPNEPKRYEFEGFAFEQRLRFEDVIHLSCNEDILNLFTMTPYYWKTSPEAAQRLSLLPCLKTEICFEAAVFRKN